MRKKIRFLTTEQFESEGRGKGPIFEADKEYTFDADFADRWLRRDCAVLIEEIPEELDGADPAEVARIEAALQERYALAFNGMADALAAARATL